MSKGTKEKDPKYGIGKPPMCTAGFDEPYTVCTQCGQWVYDWRQAEVCADCKAELPVRKEADGGTYLEVAERGAKRSREKQSQGYTGKESPERKGRRGPESTKMVATQDNGASSRPPWAKPERSVALSPRGSVGEVLKPPAEATLGTAIDAIWKMYDGLGDKDKDAFITKIQELLDHDNAKRGQRMAHSPWQLAKEDADQAADLVDRLKGRRAELLKERNRLDEDHSAIEAEQAAVNQSIRLYDMRLNKAVERSSTAEDRLTELAGKARDKKSEVETGAKARMAMAQGAEKVAPPSVETTAAKEQKGSTAPGGALKEEPAASEAVGHYESEQDNSGDSDESTDSYESRRRR